MLVASPTPIVTLNRAFAVAEADGFEAGLRLVNQLDLLQYHLFHAVRADLLVRLKRHREAVLALDRPLELSLSKAEQQLLTCRRADVSGSIDRASELAAPIPTTTSVV